MQNCWIRLAPIVQNSPLLPSWESGPCLSPGVAGRPKRPAKHHRLVQPLPNQLPNTTQAHQTALSSFLWDLARTVRQIPTPYAPVHHFVHKSSHLLGETSYLELGASNCSCDCTKCSCGLVSLPRWKGA
ncbi:hypothetical protein Bca4012_036720 [Brassica carinata]